MKSLIQFLFVMIYLSVTIPVSASIIKQESSGPTFINVSEVPENIIEITQKWLDGFNNRDEELLSSIIDFNQIALSASKGLYDDNRKERDFAKGLSTAKNKLIKAFIQQIKKADGNVIFLGYIKRKNRIFPQLRFNLNDFGVDYQELYISVKKSGKVKIVDWYQLSSDQKISETLGVLVKLMTDPNPGLLKKLFGVIEIKKSVVNSFKALGKARQAGNYKKANEIFESLPDELKYSRILLGVGITIANFLQDDELYKKRLSQLAQYHGDNPSSAFLLLDHYFYEGNAKKALENLNTMERRVGKDGFTTLLKANLYLSLANDRSRAIALYKDAIKIEPDLEESYQALSSLYVETEEYEEAVEVLLMLEKQYQFEYMPEDFFESDENNKFKESKAFKNWMNSRIKAIN